MYNGAPDVRGYSLSFRGAPCLGTANGVLCGGNHHCGQGCRDVVAVKTRENEPCALPILKRCCSRLFSGQAKRCAATNTSL